MLQNIAAASSLMMLLGACATSGGREQSIRDHAQANNECRTRSDAGEFKTAALRAKCYNDADGTYMGPFVSPDLLALLVAKRMDLAERVDRKEMTDAQARLEFAETNSRLTSLDQNRSNATRAANAEEFAAKAQTITAMRAMMTPPPPAPVYVPSPAVMQPIPPMVICNQTGNITSCF